MNEEFILVHKKILPDYFEKVIKVAWFFYGTML